MTGLHTPDTAQPPGAPPPARRGSRPSLAGTARPRLGPGGWLRWGWRQLTSMRTALILLFLLALGSVPGSVLPQQGINPSAVQQYYLSHPAAQYFGTGKIGRDQVEDYARRKGITVAEAERWLSPVLAYERGSRA